MDEQTAPRQGGGWLLLRLCEAVSGEFPAQVNTREQDRLTGGNLLKVCVCVAAEALHAGVCDGRGAAALSLSDPESAAGREEGKKESAGVAMLQRRSDHMIDRQRRRQLGMSPRPL